MKTPYSVIGNDIYQFDVKAATFSTSEIASACLERLNSNYTDIIHRYLSGEDSKSIMIKMGAIAFHGIYLPRPVVRF